MTLIMLIQRHDTFPIRATLAQGIRFGGGVRVVVEQVHTLCPVENDFFTFAFALHPPTKLTSPSEQTLQTLPVHRCGWESVRAWVLPYHTHVSSPILARVRLCATLDSGTERGSQPVPDSSLARDVNTFSDSFLSK